MFSFVDCAERIVRERKISLFPENLWFLLGVVILTTTYSINTRKGIINRRLKRMINEEFLFISDHNNRSLYENKINLYSQSRREFILILHLLSLHPYGSDPLSKYILPQTRMNHKGIQMSGRTFLWGFFFVWSILSYFSTNDIGEFVLFQKSRTASAARCTVEWLETVSGFVLLTRFFFSILLFIPERLLVKAAKSKSVEFYATFESGSILLWGIHLKCTTNTIENHFWYLIRCIQRSPITARGPPQQHQ